jgi:o-succinylbenzoate synthase
MIMLRRVTLREIALPLREPFRISSGVVKDRRILLLELEDVDGVRVWSECVAPAFPNYSPETIDTAWLALRDWIVPFLFRSGFSRASQVHDALEGAIRGHRMAKAGIEMGLWVLEAERLGLPLSNLLGGTRTWVDVGVSLGIEASPGALADRAEREAAQGYRKIKLKIAPGSDLA